MSAWWIIVLQILAAGVFGAVIGLEREISAQQAGLRTHILVALGSALFTVAGASILGTDPTRVAAQVVTGIGFLGGGAIVRAGFTTKGLTTAASLWVTAAIGLAVGLKAWLAAALTTVVAVIVLYVIHRLEREFVPRRRGIEATLTLAPEVALDRMANDVQAILPDSRVLRVGYTDAGHTLVINAHPAEALAAVGERLRSMPGVIGVDILS